MRAHMGLERSGITGIGQWGENHSSDYLDEIVGWRLARIEKGIHPFLKKKKHK